MDNSASPLDVYTRVVSRLSDAAPTPDQLKLFKALPVVSLGPVIGEVNSTQARILIEVDKDALVGVLLNGEPSDVVLQCKANRPEVFQLDDLEPYSTTSVTFAVGGFPLMTLRGRNASASVRTLRESYEEHEFAFAFTSCNKYAFEYPGPIIGTTVDQWAQLDTQIDAEPDLRLLVLLGDQVYQDSNRADAQTPDEVMANTSDCAYIRARQRLMLTNPDTGAYEDPTEPAFWETHREFIEELHRETYRRTFAYDAQQRVFSKIGQLSMMDDHETRDDMGLLPPDSDKTSLEFWIATIARDTYQLYQRNLRLADRDQEQLIRRNFGRRGTLLFLDCLSAKTTDFDPSQTNKFFGDKQVAWMEKEIAATTGLLIIAMGQPYLFLTRFISDTVDEFLDDFKGRLNSKQFAEEADHFSLLLQKYRQAHPDNRLLLISGDIHVFCPTSVYMHDDPKTLVALQLAASGIKNGVSSTEYAGVLVGVSGSNLEHENVAGLGYYHGDCSSWCNHTSVVIPNTGAGANAITTTYDQNHLYPEYHLRVAVEDEFRSTSRKRAGSVLSG